MRRATWVRLGATAVAAVVVAEAAAWLLRPRDIEQPVHADENAYFSHAELAKARDYASGQRLILVGSLVAEGARLRPRPAPDPGRPPGPRGPVAPPARAGPARRDPPGAGADRSPTGP